MSLYEKIFPVPDPVRAKAYIKSRAEYDAMYAESIDNPEGFWAKQAERLDWFKKWDRVMDCSFKDDIRIKWYEGGKLNVSYNCLDRHVKNGRKNKAAIIWEGNDPTQNRV